MSTQAERRAAILAASATARRQALARREARAAQVQQAYAKAGDAISGWLKDNASADGDVPPEQLPAFEAFIDALLRNLQEEWQQALQEGLGELAMIGASLVEVGSASIAAQALEQLRAFTGADGLQLSDRVWRVNTATRSRIVDTLRGAILRGATARESARALLDEGKGVSAEIAAMVRAARAGSLSTAVAETLLTGPGAPMRNALRVMRTELNRAYTESFVNAAFQNADVAAVKFNLSPAHPRPDVCFRAGTKVFTEKGEVAIEAVWIGDRVLTHAGRYMPVIGVSRSASAGPLVQLDSPVGSSHSRAVVMTPNHPVLTRRGWIAAGDLQTADRLACLPSLRRSPLAPQADDATGTAAAGLPRNEPAGEVQTAEAAQGGAGLRPLSRILRTPAEALPAPTPARSPGAGTCRSPGFHLPSADSLRRALFRTAGAASLTASARCRDDACRSSGCPSPPSAGTPWSSISDPCGNPWARMTSRMQHIAAAWWRGLSGSTPSRRNSGHSPEPATAALQHQVRSPHTLPLHTESVAYVDYSIHRIEPTGETVFNLEVEEDHSYVAGGFVVHNCDMYAAANLHGLGPGVYPQGAHPYPAHPETLSYLTVVFVDEISAEDRAGRQRMSDWLAGQPQDVQAQVLGQAKAEAFRSGQVADADLLRSWRDINPNRTRP